MTIPIPESLKHLKVYRGMAVPWGVLVDNAGVVHFSVNLEECRDEMIKKDLCSICGKKLLRGRWFIGGPGSAFHSHGAYIDMPVHTACKEYAMTACPYLALPRYAKEVGPTKVKQQAEITDGLPLILIDATTIPDRPTMFVAVFATGQRYVDGGYQLHVKPRRPYLKTEFWRHGVKLDPIIAEPEARLLAAQFMEPEHDSDPAVSRPTDDRTVKRQRNA